MILLYLCVGVFFIFKQKTAYEVRISDWSSDVCSSDLSALCFILVVGSLSSTADSDLSALSAIVMTDVYGKNLARGKPDPRRMLWWGRATMVVATMLGVIFASLRLDILVMLVFVGALWGRSEAHTSELQH